MDPEKTPTEQTPPEQQHLSHTYDDDMAKAMNATDATEVQGLLTQAREKEAEAVAEVTERKEKTWYSTTGFILTMLTIALIAYGVYYYTTLTVPLQPAPSVGVFTNTDAVAISDTTIQDVLASFNTSTDLVAGKPVLINLVTDAQTKTPVTNAQLYAFIGASVPPSLQEAISSARLGVVNTGKDILPFIVVSVQDPEKASNEFTAAEPTLLAMFSQALGGSQSGTTLPSATASDGSQQAALSDLVASQQTAQTQSPEVIGPTTTVSSTFQSQYFYNLPVRTLTAIDSMTGEKKIIFLYGYATNNVIVITSIPEVLKAVYDTVISQH